MTEDSIEIVNVFAYKLIYIYFQFKMEMMFYTMES